MHTETAIAHFGSVLKLAFACEVSPQTVYHWRKLGTIPRPWARLLVFLTEGELQLEPDTPEADKAI